MDIQEAVIALASLGQDTRLKAFKHLMRAGRDGLRAGDLAAKLDVPANTLSTHLRILLHAGLVDAERSGTVINYSAKLDTLVSLIKFLIEECCDGHPEQCFEEISPMLGLKSCRVDSASCEK